MIERAVNPAPIGWVFLQQHDVQRLFETTPAKALRGRLGIETTSVQHNLARAGTQPRLISLEGCDKGRLHAAYSIGEIVTALLVTIFPAAACQAVNTL